MKHSKILKPRAREEIQKSLHSFSQEEKNLALLNATVQGDRYVVQVLLEAGADVNADNGYGWTALMYASKYGFKDIVQILLMEDVDVNAKNTEGNTALYWSSGKGFEEEAQMHGLPLKYEDSFHKKLLEITQMLLEAGAESGI
jgi:ankyrin repeat protein